MIFYYELFDYMCNRKSHEFKMVAIFHINNKYSAGVNANSRITNLIFMKLQMYVEWTLNDIILTFQKNYWVVK